MKTKETQVTVMEPAAKETASVETFITQAIEHNLPVETMERLFSLREKVKAEKAREAFTSAMSSFQSKCPIIEKKKPVNDKYGKLRYKYAPLESIVDQVRKVLGANGLSYSVDVINEQGFLVATCKITHVLGHSETSSFRVPIDEEAYMSAPQKYAAASTFAKRYAFCNALGILTGDEDTDAVDVDVEEKKIKKIDLDLYSQGLRSAKDLKTLSRIWSDIPAEAKKGLVGVKDEMKAILDTEAKAEDV